ncbi:NUDIX hydrolase [Chloroflexota bacterium]
MERQTLIARNGEEFGFHNEGQDWIASWHPPAFPPPDGKPHGSAALCLTVDREIVLVSSNGQSWDLPGGRPENDEDWRMTMEREVLEEACALVEEASLLGFSKGVCIKGPEEGLVLIRSLWRTNVSIQDWKPQYEIKHRLLLPVDEALNKMLSTENSPDGLKPIYRRWFYEALHT